MSMAGAYGPGNEQGLFSPNVHVQWAVWADGCRHQKLPCHFFIPACVTALVMFLDRPIPEVAVC